MKKILTSGGKGIVSSVHCLVWHLRLCVQILPVSLIFTNSVYKGFFLCMYFRAEYYYMNVRGSKDSLFQKNS